MACFSRFRWAFGLCVLPGIVRASWTPRPLTDFESGLPAEGSPPGYRRFRHREVHQFDDGSDLELHWEVDANPESILSLDLEHPRGVRVQECRRDGLTIHVRHEHAARVASWRHVTASDSLHGCGHLVGDHLYHRVVRVKTVRNHSRLPGVVVVRLATQELASPAQVFPHCRYYFSLVPVQAKSPEEAARHLADRRLSAAAGYGGAQVQNSLTPSGGGHQSLLNFAVPRQMSNIGYNWDYDANTTMNPQFKYTFPGGVGFVRLYQPYLKAHYSLNINFTSKIASVSAPPHVTVTAELKGYADFNLDIATAVNFKKERSAGVLKDVLQMLDFPSLFGSSGGSGKAGSGHAGSGETGSGETFLNPIKFYLGGTPLTVKPGFSCKLKAYHIGLLKGSLRVGLASNIVMRGLMTFDSAIGLVANVSATADHIKFTPPTWMLFTEHFELGMMLEPMFWIKGGFGDMKDMMLGLSLRPYLNVSIMQTKSVRQAAAAGASGGNAAGAASAMAGLAVYPFRAVGLPAGGSYAVRVTANGQSKQTAVKFSTGVAEFNDNVEDFDFGTISETALLTVPIEVAILEDDSETPVATGQAVCSTVANGICGPSPLTAEVKLGDRTVYVHLSAVWDANAKSVLMSKIKSVSLRFPAVSVSEDISRQLSSPQAMASAELRVTRNGRTYSVPLSRKDGSSALLQSRVVYDLGPCFLESWKSAATSLPDDEVARDLLTPKLELLIGGSVVGSGSMPTKLSWDTPTSARSFGSLASNLKSQLKSIPVMVPLYPPGGGTSVVGTGEIEIDVLPAQLSAFWVYPYQQEVFTVGQPYKFYWTLVNGKEGQPVNFTLTAMEVGQDGSLTPTSWQQPVKASCSVNGAAPVKRYDGGVPACLYEHEIVAPGALGDRQIVMVASWLGGSYHSPHWMVSTPVRFSRGRRLGKHGKDARWSRTALRAVNHTGFRGRAREKLDKLASHCSAEPLKYKINTGMNFVEHMKNVMFPLGGGMTGGMDRPDWTSKPLPVLKPHGSRPGGGHLSDILPKILCSGGVCDGMMPGCNRTRVNPLVINKINIKLSRPFRWKNHYGPKFRHAIAYGLALAPSVIQLGQSQAGGSQARRLQPAAGPVREGRFEVEAAGEDEELGDAEFDSTVVAITEPTDYELTDELLAGLLRRGSFRGVSDGREPTHGPVEVTELRLLAPSRREPAAAREAFYEAAAGAPSEGLPLGMPASRPHRSRQVMATSAACLAALGVVFAAVRAAIRRRGYTLVDRPDALGDPRLFA